MSARLAELGCSDREIMAITGHLDEREVSIYTRGAQKRISGGVGNGKARGRFLPPKTTVEKVGGIDEKTQ
jgi:hypothetical protein